ncbi:hypothetical protein FRB96_007629 [Tulasnella sp. 330]|nr:hypothetical protein FRB96_007629 [Tulasnella sp. 330]
MESSAKAKKSGASPPSSPRSWNYATGGRSSDLMDIFELVSTLDLLPTYRLRVMPEEDDPDVRDASQHPIPFDWLDYARLITLFDPKYTSLIEARRQQTKSSYRAGNISREDTRVLQADVRAVISPWGDDELMGASTLKTGVNWAAIMETLVDRYAGRFEYLSELLKDVIRASRSNNTASTRVVVEGQGHGATWLARTVELCSGTSTSRVRSLGLSRSEMLIADAVEAVTSEICRTLGVIWLDAFDVESKAESQQLMLVKAWLQELMRLKEWLGWDLWSDSTKCNPERCTLPQWPFDVGWNGKGGQGFGMPYYVS